MREVVIRTRCDICKGDAAHTMVVGIAFQEARPPLFLLDLCDEHATPFEGLAALLVDAAPYTGDANQPANLSEIRKGKPPTKRRTQVCELCALSFTNRGSLVNHVWRMHHVSGRRPPNPTKCPTCGTVLTPLSMGPHRASAHGYDPLAEAYELARAEPRK